MAASRPARRTAMLQALRDQVTCVQQRARLDKLMAGETPAAAHGVMQAPDSSAVTGLMASPATSNGHSAAGHDDQHALLLRAAADSAVAAAAAAATVTAPPPRLTGSAVDTTTSRMATSGGGEHGDGDDGEWVPAEAHRRLQDKHRRGRARFEELLAKHAATKEAAARVRAELEGERAQVWSQTCSC